MSKLIADIDTDNTVTISTRAQVNGPGQSRLIYADTSNGLTFSARKVV